MKLDMINIMPGNINIKNSLKNESTESSNNFIEMLDKSYNENLINNDLLEKEEQELEELMMKLIELMIKKSIEPSDIDNLAKEIGNNIEQILNLNKSNIKEIFNEFNLDKYFQGNKEDIKQTINILGSIKKESGMDGLNLVLEKLKSSLAIKKESSMNESISYEKNIEKLGAEINTESLVNENSIQINNAQHIEENSYIKADTITSTKEKMNYQNNKDISILKEIAKDDSHNFVINENRFGSNSSLNIYTSKIDTPPEIRALNFTQDIMESINYLKNNNLQELKVNLNPKELGEITIKLVKSDKETKLSVVVAKDEIYSLVNKNLQEITKHLESLDIKVNEISVDIKNDNQSSFSDNLNHQFKEQKGEKRNDHQNEGDSIETDNIRMTNDENINLLA